VSLQAVVAGLDLDQRVVRRHVAKLEAARWLGRAPWVWGEGSVVWLTGLGMEGAGLGGLRVVKAPPAPTTISHGVLVGWSAARAERRGRVWKSARELALDSERWAVRMRSERGYTSQLPDLAVWLKRAGPPVALVADSGGRREDRQKKVLEDWRWAIYGGQYSGLVYDCANDSVARWIARLAKKVHLTRPEFTVVVQPRADEIAALSPAVDDADEPPASGPQATGESDEASQADGPNRRSVARPRRRRQLRQSGPHHRRRLSLRLRCPPPSASVDIGRSSESPSQSRAGDGDVELTAHVPHAGLTRTTAEAPGRSKAWTSSMPSSAGIPASGRRPLAEASVPLKHERQGNRLRRSRESPRRVRPVGWILAASSMPWAS
jgi:hypothetical protein